MAQEHLNSQEKAQVATRKVSRAGVIAFAALVAIALAAFFLFGTGGAPGPLADRDTSYSRSTETSKAFGDTQVVQPAGQTPTTAG